MKSRKWLITGISSGLGKALAEAAMQNGDFVIGTFRQQAQVDTFNTSNKGKGFGIFVDITSSSQIEAAYKLVQEKFESIDVLVNNAGYGLAGAIEETSIQEARDLFEANFFGALLITQTFLPMLRAQKSGHIIQISSHGGFKAFPGFGLYNASKFALEGFSEALAAEVEPLGIKVSIVEPGPFRTNFADTAFQQANTIISDYDVTAGAFRQRMKQVNGSQEGDPTKAAKAIVDIVNLDSPPLRVPLGKIVLASLAAKLQSVHEDMERGRAIAENAVF
ncbi:MAG: hypothetical protein RL660_1182 [Bacteroidota bacterium]|jgi:short-subunit dehydrogenase